MAGKNIRDFLVRTSIRVNFDIPEAKEAAETLPAAHRSIASFMRREQNLVVLGLVVPFAMIMGKIL